MLSSLKIGPKLIGGFLSVALLVGLVGIFGVVSTNTVQKNNEVGVEIAGLLSLLDDLLIEALQLIETQELDDYYDIKSNFEIIRKNFDIAHIKNEERLHDIKEFENFDDSIEELTIVSNGIIAIHKEKLSRKADFDSKAIFERDLRRKIRTPLLALNDVEVTRSIGLMEYKSKEALYQYRDQKHADEWLESIERVRGIAENPALLQDIISYQLLSQAMAQIAIEQKEAEVRELVRIGQARLIIDNLVETGGKIVSSVLFKNESLTQNTRLTLSIAVIIAFVISIALGLYISRSISKPIANLSQAARSIAGGDLNKRAEVTSGDEIGQLALTFNEMAAKLKESYGVLERKVRDRTKELEEAKAVFEGENINLERFNKIAVNREMKMIKLKKEIEALKKKYGSR